MVVLVKESVDAVQRERQKHGYVTWEQKCSLFFGLSQQERRARLLKQQELQVKAHELGQKGRSAGSAVAAGGATQAEAAELYYGVMYPGCDPKELEQRFRKYGNVKWTDEVIQEIVKFTESDDQRILEIMCGAGQWAQKLAAAGCDVVATDNNLSGRGLPGVDGGGRGARFELLDALAAVSKHCPTLEEGGPAAGGAPGEGPGSAATRAGGGGAGAAPTPSGDTRAKHRTLLVVYPPATPDLSRVLDLYAGDRFVYVGEGEGGVNAEASFFRKLDERFQLSKVLDLETLPDCYERAYFLRRRAAAAP